MSARYASEPMIFGENHTGNEDKSPGNPRSTQPVRRASGQMPFLGIAEYFCGPCRTLAEPSWTNGADAPKRSRRMASQLLGEADGRTVGQEDRVGRGYQISGQEESGESRPGRSA